MKMNLGLESLQTDMGEQPTMSFEELIDFSVSMGDYSEEIRNDILIIDQQLAAIENLTSILDNFKKHGSTPVLQDLVGNQIELSEASLEGMIGKAINSVIDFIKKLLKKIKEFFTGPQNVDKIAKEAEQHLKGLDPNAILNIKVFQCFLKYINKNKTIQQPLLRDYPEWIRVGVLRLNSALDQDSNNLDDFADELYDRGSEFKEAVFLQPADVTVSSCDIIIRTVRSLMTNRKSAIDSLEKIIERLTELHQQDTNGAATDKYKSILSSCRTVLRTMHIVTTNGAKSLLSIRAAKKEQPSKPQED